MKFFKQKKATIGWSALISVILGLVVIGAVVIGVVGPGVGFAKKKFFHENQSKWIFPWMEQEFEPYVPEDYLNIEEIKVGDSMKAMQCALNSVAVGIFDYKDRDVCPSGYEVVSDGIIYGQTQVGCNNIYSEFLSFKNKTMSESVEILGNAIKDCLVKSKKSTLDNQFLMCAYFDIDELVFKELITKKVLKNYLMLEYNKDKSDKDWKQASDYLKDVKLKEIKPENGGCIYYDQDLNFINPDDIHIKDCNKNKPVDSFSCSVKSFELPQDISDSDFNKLFLQAFGDPKYLVYYEKFPVEATTYWHKEWSDMFNLYTIGFVTASGVLNVVGAGKAAKVAKLGKEVLEEGVETGIKKTTKNVVEGSVQKVTKKVVLLERAKKTSLKNIIRTLAVEEEATMVYGIGKKTSQEIGDALATRLGPRSGKEAFEKVEDEITDDIFKILTKNNIQRPQSVIVDIDQYRRGLAETIVRGGPITYINREGVFVTGSIKGAKEIFEKELTKEATQQILKKQTYRQFFRGLFKEGTENLDEALLTEAAETSLKRLIAVQAVDEALVEKSFLKGAREVGNIFLKGTVGYEKKDTVLATVHNLGKKQIPISFPSWKWGLTGPVGYVGATIGKTTFVGIPKWVANHQLPIVLLLSIYIDSIDSQNEKYIPVGVNDIALTQPSLFAPKVTYELNEEATQYFIRNEKKPNNVMYLVSPCKADFRIVKRKCDCDNNPEAAVFDFGGGLMNAEQGSITLKDYEERVEEYKKQWKSLQEDEQKRYDNINKYIDYKLPQDESVFRTFVVKHDSLDKAGSESSISKRIKEQQYQLNNLQPIIDIDNAVKMCNDKSIIKEIFKGKEIKYSIDCMELEPERLNDSYCYDHFPRTEIIRGAVTVGALVADAVIIGASLGTATIPVLVLSGFGFAAVDVILEAYEKWPSV